MIVDPSAIIAIVKGEADAERFFRAILSNGSTSMSTATSLEMSVVIDRARSEPLSQRFDSLFEALSIRQIPFTAKQSAIARAAHKRFGRASGHQARLNFGDCFSYALALDLDQPLLFKGNNFGLTDVKVAEF